ncbi:MAG: class I SAM-dependent methyltransferase [Sphingomonadaceae bacterium]
MMDLAFTPALSDRLGHLPATAAIVGHVLACWPEHASYCEKSLAARDAAIDGSVEEAAGAALRLMAGREREVAADYRWTCDQLRDEELFFHREGRYRRTTFQQAWDDVYSDAAYMARYVNGLLVSQILWFNHAATLAMLKTQLLDRQQQPFDYLEVGPGHGLMCHTAARNPLCRQIEAIDVSAVSLAETREALSKMGVSVPVRLTEMDILSGVEPQSQADVIVISEVLEHLERPDLALALLRRVARPQATLFVNVPLNSPSPDHIYLFEHPDEVTALVEGAGFRVEQLEMFATQGRPIDKALKQKVSVSVGVIARPA